MVAPLNKTDFIKLRELILQSCGIFLDDDKDYLVETRLSSLAEELGCRTFFELYTKIIQNKELLLPKLIDLMTTNETYWFRDDSLWTTLEQRVIPPILEQLARQQKINYRIWSAACSTGQELYSLKILFTEIAQRMGLRQVLKNISFVGTDISSTVLFLAKNGRYNTMSLSRGLSDIRLQKFFDKVSDTTWQVKSEIKENIQFQHFNLLNSFSSLGKFDIILCRNVLIYFSTSCRKELLDKFYAALQSDGSFFLGASESMFNYSNRFTTIEFGRGVYYQPKLENAP